MQVSVGHVDVGQSATLAIKACGSGKSPTAHTAAKRPPADTAAGAAPAPASGLHTLPPSAAPGNAHAEADTSYREARHASVAFEGLEDSSGSSHGSFASQGAKPA